MSGKELPKPAAQIKLQRVYDTIVTNVRECQQRFIDNNILNENTQYTGYVILQLNYESMSEKELPLTSL